MGLGVPHYRKKTVYFPKKEMAIVLLLGIYETMILIQVIPPVWDDYTSSTIYKNRKHTSGLYMSIPCMYT